jgi:uncharacterized protein
MSPERKTRRKIDPRLACYRLRARRSPIHGFGVFAAEPIPAGKRVIEYSGERISLREAFRRVRQPRRPKKIVLARLNRYWCVDAVRGGSGAEYINHSCDPNLCARKTARHIFLFSRRRIRKGAELTFDYRLHPATPKLPCRCGSPKCRGVINRP